MGLLIFVAGASSNHNFEEGLNTFIYRTPPPHETTFLNSGGFGHWGPGRIITVNLSPAIIVLAFPCSKHMPEVQDRLHLLLPVTLLAVIISFLSTAAVGRALIVAPDPHSGSDTRGPAT